MRLLLLISLFLAVYPNELKSQLSRGPKADFSAHLGTKTFASVKEDITCAKSWLQKELSSQERSQHLLKLACAFIQDQEIDEGFHAFLEALASTSREKEPEMSSQEKEMFEEAFLYYLSHEKDPSQTASLLLEKYEPVLQEHPEYIHLGFLLATVQANQGNYEKFFQKFYQYYPSLWDTFLAYKTCGILWLRLSRQQTSAEGRLAFEKRAVEQLQKALEKPTKDPNVYKIVMVHAKEQGKSSQVHAYLRNIVEYGVPMGRLDVLFYVQEAVSLKDYALAEAILDQARLLYKSSQLVTAAQEYLDQQKREG